MIRNQWYVVLESQEVRNKPVNKMRMGESLVFWRDSNGKVACFPDKCPHRGVKLSMGTINKQQLQCPFHGLEFESSGRCVCIPANGKNTPVPANFNIKAYPTYEKHGFIWIFWGDKIPDDEPQYFDNLYPHRTSRAIQDKWSTHYSRVIENQLDVAHLPFIHRKTIGRGNRTLVDGPVTQWVNDNKFFLYVFNRNDDGRPPRKTSEIKQVNENGFRIEFIFPNLWQNKISDKFRLVIAFVPVDEENTIMYLRVYQKLVTLPLLSTLFNILSTPMNLRIAHEDRRVVNTHHPKESALIMKENLFQADMPIIEYRKRREELKKG